MSESYSTSHDQPAPKRRRRRPALSCEQCRRRKMKCDRGDPCGQCVQARNRECTYYSHTPPADASTNSLVQPHIPIAAQFFADTQPTFNPKPPSEALSYPTPQTLPSIPSWTSMPSTPANGFGGTPGKALGGTFSKTRLFGQSHWMHSFGRFNSIISLKDNPVLNSTTFKDEWSKTEIMALIRRCKAMARSEKMDLHDEWLLTPDLKTLIPPRAISDTLTALYFSTGESLYRILHYPTFNKEYNQYWTDPSSASSAFILKMLLAMANGACFYQESDVDNVRSQAKKWIFAGQHWLSHMPTEKRRLNISGIQVHCLLILARQAHGLVGDLAWISIGSLIRAGFNMGLQRDPKFFPNLSLMQGEMRRRLWATILELNVQLSLDMGMNPLISVEDYDTMPPGNFDDCDLDDSSTDAAFPKPNHVFTQCTIPRVLLDSLHLRLRACKLINDFRGDVSYETILELGAQLTKACKEATLRTYNSQSQSSVSKMTQLQRNLLDISIRRFLFLLHGDFSIKGLTDPHYYFSRKVCLDSAVLMATYPTSEDGTSVMPLDHYPRDQHTLLKIASADFFKRVMLHCTMTIFHDMLQQIEDDLDSPMAVKEQGRRSREPMKAILMGILDLVAARMPFAVSNVKCHLFLSAVLGQLEALEKGGSPEMGAMEGAKKSARICLSILDSRISRPRPEKSDLRPRPELPTPVEQSPMDRFGMEDWNIDLDLDGSDSWLFAGWEDDRSW